jgi:Flp pilus assembly pilin Flp
MTTDTKIYTYTNRKTPTVALLVEVCVLIITLITIQNYHVDYSLIIVFALFISIAMLITISILVNPIKYIFAHDGNKFGFKRNDDLIIEGYFLDVESLTHQQGVMSYQSEIAQKTSDGDYVAPYVISRRNDLIITLKGKKPLCLPSGFTRVYNDFISAYKKSV